MTQSTPQLSFFLHMSRAHAIVSRAFDRGLPGGLGLNDFIILYHLSNAADERMRRTDLAEKLGLTQSGVTRMLLPMEKIGLVKREESEFDGRVSFVKLASGGKRLLSEAMESAELRAEELLGKNVRKTEELTALLSSF
jgi:DNA-binding MarR family transcriptional regulator